MSRSSFTLALLMSAGLAVSGVARAQGGGGGGGEPSAAEIAVARKLFNEASELEKKKDYAAAEPKLREALAIKETPGLRYHLGFSLEQQGKLVSALVEYDRAAELLEHGAKAPDVAELIGPARDGVRKRVAHVRVKLPKGVKDPSVEVDGAAVKLVLLNEPLPQNPGRHVLTVSAPGRQPFRQELDLDESESRDVEVDLPPVGKSGAGAAASAAEGAPASSDQGAGADARIDTGKRRGGNTARTAVLIGEGVLTVAGVVVGIVYTSKKGHAQDQIDAANAELNDKGYKDSSVCAQSPLPTDAKSACSQLPGLVDQRDTDKRMQILGFVGAGVGAVATVTTYLLWKPAKPAESAFSLAPFALPGGYGLGASGRF